MGLQNTVHRRSGVRTVQRVGDLTQSLKTSLQFFVIFTQSPRGGLRHRRLRERAGGAERPQRIENDGDVDRLLYERPCNGRHITECRGRHRCTRKRHTYDDALHGDGARAPSDYNRLRNAIEPIDEDDDVRRLRRGARAASTHGHTDVRRGEGRGVVDAVANHQGRSEAAFPDNGVNLVRWDTLREHCIKIESGADRFGRFRTVACHHDNSRDASSPQSLNRSRRLATQLVR